MSESCNQYGDNGDDSQYRCADPAEGCTQLSEDAGAALHGYHQFLDALCSARVSLHALTHGGYYRTKDYEEGAEGCDHQSDGYDGFPLRFIHVVQLSYKSLYSGDDLADYGHQHFAKRNGQLFQLAFEDAGSGLYGKGYTGNIRFVSVEGCPLFLAVIVSGRRLKVEGNDGRRADVFFYVRDLTDGLVILFLHVVLHIVGT